MKTLTNETIVRLMLWGSLVGLFLGMVLVIFVLDARVQHLEERLDVATNYISELETVVESTTNAEFGDVVGGDVYAKWYSQE